MDVTMEGQQAAGTRKNSEGKAEGKYGPKSSSPDFDTEESNVIRSISDPFHEAYRSEPVTRFPPSGIVMVKDPLHPEQPFWPARILSFSDYTMLYQSIPHENRPGEKDVGVVVFSPPWSSELTELRCIPATSACVAPYQGLFREAAAGAAEQGADDKGQVSRLFEGITANSTSFCSTSSAPALRRAKRRLVSAHYIADSLHRMALRSGLGPCPPPRSKMAKTKRFNPAYFQVAEFPESVHGINWALYIDPDQGFKGLDSILGLTDNDWESDQESREVDPNATLCGCLMSRGEPSLVFDLYSCVAALDDAHPPDRMRNEDVPYGSDALNSTFVDGSSAGVVANTTKESTKEKQQCAPKERRNKWARASAFADSSLITPSSHARVLPHAELTAWWLCNPESLTGCSISLLWNRSKTKFYDGVVLFYRSTSREHFVRFDDGDERFYDLAKRTFRIQESPTISYSVSSSSSSSSSSLPQRTLSNWREYEFCFGDIQPTAGSNDVQFALTSSSFDSNNTENKNNSSILSNISTAAATTTTRSNNESSCSGRCRHTNIDSNNNDKESDGAREYFSSSLPSTGKQGQTIASTTTTAATTTVTPSLLLPVLEDIENVTEQKVTALERTNRRLKAQNDKYRQALFKTDHMLQAISASITRPMKASVALGAALDHTRVLENSAVQTIESWLGIVKTVVQRHLVSRRSTSLPLQDVRCVQPDPSSSSSSSNNSSNNSTFGAMDTCGNVGDGANVSNATAAAGGTNQTKGACISNTSPVNNTVSMDVEEGGAASDNEYRWSGSVVKSTEKATNENTLGIKARLEDEDNDDAGVRGHTEDDEDNTDYAFSDDDNGGDGGSGTHEDKESSRHISLNQSDDDIKSSCSNLCSNKRSVDQMNLTSNSAMPLDILLLSAEAKRSTTSGSGNNDYPNGMQSVPIMRACAGIESNSSSSNPSLLNPTPPSFSSSSCSDFAPPVVAACGGESSTSSRCNHRNAVITRTTDGRERCAL